MKKFLFMASLLAIISCQRNEPIIPSENSSTNGLRITSALQDESGATSNEFSFTYKVTNEDRYFKMESVQNNNLIHSVLSYKAENQDWQQLNEIRLNLADDAYREKVNQQIVEAAERLKERFDHAYLSNLESLVDQFPILVFEKLGVKEYSKDQPLTIFHHLGVIKTAKRALESSSQECRCAPFANYLQAEAPFFCNEDKLVNASELAAIIQQKIAGNPFSDKIFTAKEALDFLANSPNQMISANKIDRMLKAEFNEFWSRDLSQKERDDILTGNDVSTNGRLPYDPACLMYAVQLGSDCGCCGNYSGICGLCHISCYIHDHTCEDCSPSWYCLSGCVPGPCASPFNEELEEVGHIDNQNPTY